MHDSQWYEIKTKTLTRYFYGSAKEINAVILLWRQDNNSWYLSFFDDNGRMEIDYRKIDGEYPGELSLEEIQNLAVLIHAAAKKGENRE